MLPSRASSAGCTTGTGPACATWLERGALPVEELAALAWREGLRPRPIYGAHRWFARRLGTAFRALLTAAALPAHMPFWPAYYGGVSWRGKTVLDPFVGGGTTVVEAQRLGAWVIGVDVDPVACAITRFELRAAAVPDLAPALRRLQATVGARLAPYYQTLDEEGAPATALHYFWVQVVDCAGCGAAVEAHPHYQLAHEARGARQWVFCPTCHAVHALPRDALALTCASCGRVTDLRAAPVRFGRLTCPRCGARERLIDVATRTGAPPAWRLFAVEYLAVPPGTTRRAVPLAARRFRAATAHDLAVYAAAAAALRARQGADGRLPGVPERAIPVAGRADDRLPRYGYTRYRELFNARQLLHLSLLAEALAAEEAPVREALALAFSDHLTTNCRLTSYAFGWRRVAPLFALRAYRHIPRPVEVNPWLDGTGRGTFPNAVRQVQRAVGFARAPREPVHNGGFRPAPPLAPAGPDGGPLVLHADARALDGVPDASVDLVLTDPPYFDNIAYAELSDFYLPWLQALGLAPRDGQGPSALLANLAARGRDARATATFAAGLGQSFREMARVLRPDGRLVFTYQHRAAAAWLALAQALVTAPLCPLQVFPLLGDAPGSLHTHVGSSKWDAVFVLARAPAPGSGALWLPATAERAARAHAAQWTARLRQRAPVPFRAADARSFARACLVAAALGLWPADGPTDTGRPLAAALAEERLSQPAGGVG
ncbi:MAG: DNA methyltransferase [Chloroflexi bacterium]|nr:DNA methyltransferase [Chloroflexota bacterium]